MESQSPKLKLRRRSVGLLLAIILFGGITQACASQTLTAEESLERFYQNQGPEDTLMDPLILAGDKVVPVVIEKVKEKKMVRRRYAIGFLGNGSYTQALPVLKTILQDSSELDYFRSDALHAIYQIDASSGLQLAQSYRNEPNFLGQASQDLLSERHLLPHRRSYLDALLGRHD